MPCFIVASDIRNERVRLLARLAEQLGHPTTAVADLDHVAGHAGFTKAGRCFVLLPDFGSAATSAEAALRFAQAHHRSAFVVYIADTIAPEIYKQLARTRAGEWIGWPALPGELREVLAHVATADTPARTAKVVSFLPSKGGVGNTTLAQETGVYLATRRNRNGPRVAILDLNLEGGTLADALDLEPRFDVREIMGQPERLDEQLVDIFTSRHSARLDVFASPLRRINGAEVDPQLIFLVLDALSDRYDLVLVDIPNQRSPWIDNVLQGSNVVVVTGAGTVPALKQLGAKLGYLDDIAISAERIAAAINQCDSNLLGRVSRRSQIAGTVPGRQVFYIRRDVRAFEDALNTGRPMMAAAPRGRATRDIRELAQWIESAVERPSAPVHAATSEGGTSL